MADAITVKERVIILEKTVPEIYKALGAVDTRTTHIENDTKEVRRSIYGFDSTPGMLHMVETLKEKMDDIKKMVWAIIIIVLGIAVGGVYEAIVHAASVAK
jgi:archaellum component FlaC